jgi:hypothetical protein
MRYIAKPAEEPVAIREYVVAQTPVGHGLDYPTFASTRSPNPPNRTRGGELCQELVAQQFGLCAYTGAGIDGRLGSLSDPAKRLKFKAHNEHLKPQSKCREEIEARGHVYGTVVAEDMDHRNIVAALMVEGAGGKTKVSKADLFGAAHRENDRVPVLPTDPACESRFNFAPDGSATAALAADTDAEETIRVLNLGHGTLTGWRKTAIETFTEVITSREDAELIIERTTTPQNGKLPEYCFAIRQVAQLYLDLAA